MFFVTGTIAVSAVMMRFLSKEIQKSSADGVIV